MLGLGLTSTLVSGAFKNFLRLWLAFDEVIQKEGGQYVLDKSGKVNDATLHTGRCLTFDGTDDYVSLSTTLEFTGAWTLAFWLKDYTPDELDFCFGSDTTGYNIGLAYSNGTNYRVPFFRDGNSNYYPFTNFEFDATNSDAVRLVFTCNGSGDISFCKDGVFIEKISPTDTTLKLKTFGVGYKSGTRDYFAQCKLSDIEVYDAAWNQGDVTFDYTNPQHLAIDNPSTSLVLSDLQGYWHLSEGDGAICYDSSGNGNNGSIYGAGWLLSETEIPQMGLMDWVKSTPASDEVTLISDPNDADKDILDNTVRLREHALNLDGVGYAEVADADTLDMNVSTGFSVSVWKKMSAYTNYGTVIAKGKGLATSGTYGFALSYYTDNKFYADINTSAGRFTAVSSAQTFDDTWKFFTVSYDGDNVRLYINNSLAATSSQVSGTIDESHSFTVGTDKDYANKDDSLIDEIMWHVKVLSAADVTKYYNSGLVRHSATSTYSDDYSKDYGYKVNSDEFTSEFSSEFS